MNNYLNELQTMSNVAYTRNGAVSNASTGDSNLDLFAQIGSLRHVSDKQIIDIFSKAFYEKREWAMKILFYARDIRQGLGERRIFRVCMNWLVQECPEIVINNIDNFPEFGRFDDLWDLLDCGNAEVVFEILSYVKQQLTTDLDNMFENKPISLLAKWLPSENASSKDTKRHATMIREFTKLSPRNYRKMLSRMRRYSNILEPKLTEKDYTFDYSKVPGRAMLKYSKAFKRNDYERYTEYLESVDRGEKKMNASTIYPYDIVSRCLGSINSYSYMYGRSNHGRIDRKELDTIWNAIPDYTKDENAIVMLDGSGSMYGKPLEIGMSLAIYFAEHNKGPFQDYFMTFSHKPRLVEIKGQDIYDKVKFCFGFNEVADTNLEAGFKLLLDAAIKSHATADDMPKKLYIISDMEFNSCVKNSSLTNFENAKQMFAEHGYELPQIVFWKVNTLSAQQPVTKNDRNVCLVSGSSPVIFQQVLEGEVDPISYMLSVINKPRYEVVSY